MKTVEKPAVPSENPQCCWLGEQEPSQPRALHFKGWGTRQALCPQPSPAASHLEGGKHVPCAGSQSLAAQQSPAPALQPSAGGIGAWEGDKVELNPS